MASVIPSLESQALSERCHLGQKEVAELLDEARRQQGRQKRRLRNGFVWSVRVAALLAVCASATYLLYVGPEAGRLAEEEIATALSLPEGNGGNYAVPLLSPAAEHEAAIMEVLSNRAGEPAVPRAIQSLDQRVRRLRRDVNRRRESLLDLMERDLGEQMRQDVQHASRSHRVRLA